MSRLALWILLASAVLGAAVVIGISWNERAGDICREQAARTASEGSVTWKWNDFAYVCDDRVPGEQPKRIGIVDAFHGDERRRHGVDP